MPMRPPRRWQGGWASAKLPKNVGNGGAGMSESGLRNLSFGLLLALVAYVAWSGGM